MVQWQLRNTSIKERKVRKTQHSIIRCKDTEKEQMGSFLQECEEFSYDVLAFLQ